MTEFSVNGETAETFLVLAAIGAEALAAEADEAKELADELQAKLTEERSVREEDTLKHGWLLQQAAAEIADLSRQLTDKRLEADTLGQLAADRLATIASLKARIARLEEVAFPGLEQRPSRDEELADAGEHLHGHHVINLY